METTLGHLTFCSNIFPGETWEDHFRAIRESVPEIKKEVAPEVPFGIGLRLSHPASVTLAQPEALASFQQWLKAENCYVFTINGFPYGDFHRTRVKDRVHAPDWTTPERVAYTRRLAEILAALLPEGMEGSISTSPLSYKPWSEADPEKRRAALREATAHIAEVISDLYRWKESRGKTIHLAIEPEADGLLETWIEFRDWFLGPALAACIPVMREKYGLDRDAAEEATREHLRLCYDVCHFAVGFEQIDEVLSDLTATGIRIGKWQLSAALKMAFPGTTAGNAGYLREIGRFDEPFYLHQVVARGGAGLVRFRDLPEALAQGPGGQHEEWRSHFHVPLFVDGYGGLGSTRQDVVEALAQQAAHPYCRHLEVETYTWDVLPPDLRLPLARSVSRELDWVLEQIHSLEKTRKDA